MKKLYLIILFLVILTITIVYHFFIPTKRYAIFAGYNQDETIPPYVITYLQGLDEISDGIIYITDSSLKPEEQAKLTPFNIIYQQHHRHNEYDWGSYKRGYLWLKENNLLKKTKELILANDSCIAPITSFVPMFKEMEKYPEISMWSNTQDRPLYPHLQSYFLVLRHNALNSSEFIELITSVTHQPHRTLYVDKYEISLSNKLKTRGFAIKSYIPQIRDKNIFQSPILYLTHTQNQFIKKKRLTTPLFIDYLKNNHPKTYEDILKSNLLPTGPLLTQPSDQQL